MEKLRKAEALLLRAEGAAVVALLSTMILLSAGQVVLRQVWGVGILWGDTFLRHLVLWVGFLGAAAATADEKHFAFEALAGRLPERVHGLLAAIAHACTALISFLLAKAAWSFVLEEKASASALFSIGSLEAPAWLFASILPLGFFLVALHSLLRAAIRSRAGPPRLSDERPPSGSRPAPASGGG